MANDPGKRLPAGFLSSRTAYWKISIAALALCAAGVALAPVDMLFAKDGGNDNNGGGDNKVSSLVGVKPVRPDLSGVYADAQAVAQLGKALFWDIQAGSDGQACASCHFNAGADIRIKNQVNPWFDEAAKANPQSAAFSKRKSNDQLPTGPNAELVLGDFPFKTYADPANRGSRVLYETNDRFSSSGTFAGDYSHVVNPAGPVDEKCPQAYNPNASPFHKAGYVSRRVEPRNTPTTVNAVFNFRQFWDGRANASFNGVNPFGPRDASARVLVDNGAGPQPQVVLIPNASLASQAVGPTLSDNEMSCSDRHFNNVAHKLLALTPLGQQIVHKSDSLLGPLAKTNGNGLTTSYEAMIKKAFKSKYYSGGTNQIEANFAFFWGLAVMEYEAQLVSDQSPFDNGSLTDLEKSGKNVFEGKARCTECHAGPLLTKAAITTADGPNPSVLERVSLVDGTKAIADRGFRNIGVRPSREDRGLGGQDPFGFPLSFSREFILRQAGISTPDVFNASGVNAASTVGLPATSRPRDNADGAFKIPGLRNVGLTAPYFHNGGQATLEQVVEFYNRGGDRQSFANGTDSSGTADLPILSPTTLPDASNVDVNIKDNGLGLSTTDKAALVAFLKSLTDNRVACHSGPFDHPSLPLSMGLVEDLNGPGTPGTGQRATDIIKVLPATGTGGLTAEGKPCMPNSGSLFGDTQTTFQRILN